jgi:hypothetical protein
MKDTEIKNGNGKVRKTRRENIRYGEGKEEQKQNYKIAS